ncbi:MAG: TIGR03016 family PEP-CTERM system-associated outer membrane protein [Betaproteobacteria bacterium]|nr:TIGR03016 family PEP-CTERM system-associated outer membrane protein [Betaproteobacteria bacterium]
MAASTLVPHMSYAADWQVTPKVQLRETYTDNVRLAPRGREESDFVTEIEPGVAITGVGPRLQMQLDYAFKYRLYAKNSDANGHNHALRANGLLDVWDRKLFLQGSAAIAQQNISTLGPQSTSDININPNRTEVRQGTLSPYWISRLGRFANVNARYTWNRMESDGETSALSSESNTVNLGLSQGSMFNELGWSVSYSRQDIDSTQGQFNKRTLETLTASASYALLPTLSGLLSIGREDNAYGDTQGSIGGNFYSVGFQWAPSRRTNIRAEVGERYFGNTFSLDAQHRTRLTAWTLTYGEQVVGTPGLLSVPVSLDTAATVDRLFISQVPDPIQRQQVVQAFIAQNGLPQFLPSSVDFLTNQVSLSKRWQGTFGLRGIRSALLLSLFRDDRQRESSGTPTIVGTDPFSLSDNVLQTGYNAILSWRFSERTSGSVSVGQIKSEMTDASRTDTNSNIRIGITHQLQPKLRGSVEYRWLNRDTNSSAGDVRENAITGTLSLAF